MEKWKSYLISLLFYPAIIGSCVGLSLLVNKSPPSKETISEARFEEFSQYDKQDLYEAEQVGYQTGFEAGQEEPNEEHIGEAYNQGYADGYERGRRGLPPE